MALQTVRCEENIEMVTFPYEYENYMCCCGSMHIRAASLTVVIIHAVLSLLVIGFGIANDAPEATYVIEGVELLCIVVLYFGLYRKSSLWLLPYLAYTLFSLFFSAILIIFTAVDANHPHVLYSIALDYVPRRDEHTALIMLLSFYFVLHAWILSIVHTSYRYYSHAEMFFNTL